MADPRLTPARADLAAAHLRGQVEAAHFVDPVPMQVSTPVLDLRCAPEMAAALDHQLLHGQAVAMIEDDPATGLAWVQARDDGYVGYVSRSGLVPATVPATHRVVTLGAQVYGAPRLKAPPQETLPFQARVTVSAQQCGYGQIGPDRWIAMAQLSDRDAPDPVAEALRLTGAPYVWGGSSHAGLDCSSLVQLSHAACGRALPRDTDMQEGLGVAVDGPAARGDLVFWRGHVGIMVDAVTLLHANAHHMAVVAEPLAVAVARIAATDTGPVTAMRRLGA